MSARGPAADTAAGEVVLINLPSDGPYGVNFAADEDGNALVVKVFDRLPNGKFGPIQKHGGVHYGDVLFEINDTSLMNVPFADALRMVEGKNLLRKGVKFMNSREYYRKKRSTNLKASALDQKNNFLSVIKQYRISQDVKKYVEYEIACQYRIASVKGVDKDVVYQWTVWKRYSDFAKLHAAMKVNFGWLMNGIELPSPYNFSLNKLAPDFIQQRREELKSYWLKLVAIEKVTEFSKHHCSADLREFLVVDEHISAQNSTQSTATEIPDINDNESVNGGGSIAENRRISKRVSVKRLPSRQGSLKKASSFKFDDGASSGSISSGSKEDKQTTGPSIVEGAVSSSIQQQTPVNSTKPQPPPPRPNPPPPVLKAPSEDSGMVVSPRPDQPTPPTRPPPPPPIAPPAQPKPVQPVAQPVTQPVGGSLPKPDFARSNLLSSIKSMRKD